MVIAHRRRAGICMGVMARLPWWACVSLAAFTYVALHCLTLRPRIFVVDPGDVHAALAGFLLGGLAESLQYLLPALWVSVLLARFAWLAAEAAGPRCGGTPDKRLAAVA